MNRQLPHTTAFIWYDLTHAEKEKITILEFGDNDLVFDTFDKAGITLCKLLSYQKERSKAPQLYVEVKSVRYSDGFEKQISRFEIDIPYDTKYYSAILSELNEILLPRIQGII